MYALTISPPARHYAKSIDLYNNDMEHIRRFLNKFSSYYCLYPEFDNKFRLHYHGLVYVKDKIKLAHTKYLFDKGFGYTKFDIIKSFNDKLKWLLYSTKQWAENSHYFIAPIMYKNMRRKKVQQDDKVKTILDWLS